MDYREKVDEMFLISEEIEKAIIKDLTELQEITGESEFDFKLDDRPCLVNEGFGYIDKIRIRNGRIDLHTMDGWMLLSHTWFIQQTFNIGRRMDWLTEKVKLKRKKEYEDKLQKIAEHCHENDESIELHEYAYVTIDNMIHTYTMFEICKISYCEMYDELMVYSSEGEEFVFTDIVKDEERMELIERAYDEIK